MNRSTRFAFIDILGIALCILFFCLFGACGGGGDDDDDSTNPTPTPTSQSTPTATPVTEVGRVVYTLPDGTIHSIAAVEGAAPVSITQSLDSLASGSDEWGTISPDGEWLLISSDRFSSDCIGWECLALVKSDFSSGQDISSPSGHLRSEGFSAVASGGNTIVYAAGNGPHDRDLWATHRDGSGWTEPVLLTGSSPFTWHQQPAISSDGSKVCFDCGPEPYAIEGTGICEVNVDGSGFRTVIMPADGPGGSNANALHQPDYAPDGSIVFEADWNGEQIWRLAMGSSTPICLSGSLSNDNSPAVLPDGRVASLWLDRPGGPGYHELKIMDANGASWFMLLTNTDIADYGMGCGL